MVVGEFLGLGFELVLEVVELGVVELESGGLLSDKGVLVGEGLEAGLVLLKL